MDSRTHPHVSPSPAGLPMPPRGRPWPPHSSAVRVGDAERDEAVERIKNAFAEGRLDLPEFDMRTHLALTARTRADLNAVLDDLEPLQVVAHRRGGAGPPARPHSTAGERAWGMVTHWSALPTFFLGPLIVLLTKGRQSPFVRHHAVEALNFQLTFLLAQLVLIFTVIGAILYVPLVICWMVLVCAGGIGAVAGDAYRYPKNIRLVR